MELMGHTLDVGSLIVSIILTDGVLVLWVNFVLEILEERRETKFRLVALRRRQEEARQRDAWRIADNRARWAQLMQQQMNHADREIFNQGAVMNENARPLGQIIDQQAQNIFTGMAMQLQEEINQMEEESWTGYGNWFKEKVNKNE